MFKDLFKDAGNLGPFLLVGAGFIIFPVQGGLAIYEFYKDYLLYEENKKINKKDAWRKFRPKLIAAISTISLAVLGFAVTAALLAFILVDFAILTAAASIAIPAIGSVISGVELVDSIGDLWRAKKDFRKNPTVENKEKVIDAKRSVIFKSNFLGFGLAITVLATLSVLTGLGVISFGLIPSFVLIGVALTGLAIKIFEIVDEKKGHRMTNAIRRFFTREKELVEQQSLLRPTCKESLDNPPNIQKELGIGINSPPPIHESDLPDNEPYTPPPFKDVINPDLTATNLTPTTPLGITCSAGGD